MQLNSVEELVSDIRMGRMVILMDDEDRENEGDLIMAAELVRPEDINFMAKHARGLICLPMTRERCSHLGLDPMVDDSNARYHTKFTVSIEAAEGVTTGISAADRAHTIRVAVGRDTRPEDLVQPGHVFPLIAEPGGVLARAGHTEAGCDLARLAGLMPAAVIVEIMNDDGTMARRPQLEVFAKTHQLKIGTIADLIHYRILMEKTIERRATRTLRTPQGTFTAVTYHDEVQNCQHLALVCGQPTPEEPTLVRVHFPDVLRDLLGLQRPGYSSWPLHAALEAVQRAGQGVVVLLQGGAQNLDPAQVLEESALLRSSVQEGTARAYHTIGTGSQILRDLGVRKMRVMSTPMKFSALSGFDLQVEEYLSYPEQADGEPSV